MRNTDPARSVVAAIRERDGGCVVCGTHWSPTTQHRVARGMGGTRSLAINLPSNLITLCGSGTTGCHGWVEHHPVFSREAGWSVPRGVDPRTVPVLYPNGWYLLNDDCELIPSDGLPVPTDPRGHRGGRVGGWGVPVDDPDVGGSWPPPAAGETAAPDAVRPWGSPLDPAPEDLPA
jgi:hypothetical protein